MFSYISGNGTFLYFLKKRFFLYFEKLDFLDPRSKLSGGNFVIPKNKKTYPKNVSYISGEGTF